MTPWTHVPAGAVVVLAGRTVVARPDGWTEARVTASGRLEVRWRSDVPPERREAS